ncbi:HNH endonuclease signature motif containing protein [Nocardioides campestrisoli]|uniref:HNH endonuclease signature motif containing protein n=1 Tax=Nocardioides campestrisoli TaxID=2736757 RepID=UPI0015E6C1DA|nr:HNH endonuclease signature motif containing protein [Nocardioides campestrisoli]
MTTAAPPTATRGPSQSPDSCLAAALVAAAQDAVRAAGGVAPGTLGPADLAEVLQRTAELESAATALRLALCTEADVRRIAEDPDVGGAATGTDAWLARLLGTTRESQASGLRLGRLLSTTYHTTREAFAAGRLRPDQVRVIVHAAELAPERATPEQVRAAEELLVAKATGEATRTGRPMNAKRLRQAARRMFDPLDRGLADEHEHALLTREKHGADRETFLSLHDNGDGTWSGKFRIPELHGNLLATVLGHLTSPRRLSMKRAADGTTTTTVDPTAPESQSYLETQGQGLCELIEHLPTTGLAPSQATVLVTLDLQSLLDGLGAAKLDTGIHITAGDARRMACEAGLVPAVLGGKSEPLDLGRERRLHSVTQRRGLSLTHDTCAAAGCKRPFAWCEIHHHRLSWGSLGPTDLDNGLPLCGHHHRKAHDPGWDLRHHPSGEWRFHRRR